MIEPIVRLEQMDAAEYERVVGEWAYSFLKGSKDYYDVVLMGGSSDSGRDLVAYLDDEYNSVMTLDVYFRCTPYKYSEEIKDYDIIPNSYETIAVNFFLYKEEGEWVIENEKILYGNYYNYAVGCKNKTWGRFPEVDRYDVFDYTICEYAERLYNFGGLPPY